MKKNFELQGTESTSDTATDVCFSDSSRDRGKKKLKTEGHSARGDQQGGLTRKSNPIDINLLFTGFIAAGLTALFYWIVLPTFKASHLGQLFGNRGWVPYFIVLLTLWSYVKLTFKYIKLLQQKKSLRQNLLPTKFGKRISPDNIQLFLDHLKKYIVAQPSNILINRIARALQQFSMRRDAHKAGEYLNTLAYAAADAVESSYTVLKVFGWAIPILGFIGTVNGIGQAVEGFSQSIQAAQELSVLTNSLGSVTSGLGVAFDTTLLALVMSLLVMFPMTVLQKAEDCFLVSVEDYCSDNLLCRLDGEAESVLVEKTIEKAIAREMAKHQSIWSLLSQKLETVGKTIIDDIAAGLKNVHDTMYDCQKAEAEQLTSMVATWQREVCQQMESSQREWMNKVIDAQNTIATTASYIQQQNSQHLKDQLDRLQEFNTSSGEQSLQQAEMHNANMKILSSNAQHHMEVLNDMQKQSKTIQTELLKQLEQFFLSSGQGIDTIVGRIVQPLTGHLKQMEKLSAAVSGELDLVDNRSQSFSDSMTDLDKRLKILGEVLNKINHTLAEIPSEIRPKTSRRRTSSWSIARIFGSKEYV